MPDAVVYVSYNEIGSPLVESQVLSYLRRLSELGYSFELVTFEPRAPSEDDRVRIRELLAADSIVWTWLRRPERTRPVAAVWRVLKGAWVIRRILRRSGARIVHARSFVPAALASLSACGMRVRLLYDIRGFWVEEKVMKGSLLAGGVVYRLLKLIDRRVYRRTAAVVSLTGAAIPRIESLYREDLGLEPPRIEVIPTCVDVDRFVVERKALDAQAPVFCCVGSLGVGYLGEEVFRFFNVALQTAFPKSRLVVVSRSDRRTIREMLSAVGVPAAQVDHSKVRPSDVPRVLARCDVGLSFVQAHHSKIASFPTKVAEYLAAGLPIVSVAGTGDVDRVLVENSVGVCIATPDRVAMTDSIGQLKSLLEDPRTAERCRRAARELFSLDAGVKSYASLYGQLGKEDVPTGPPDGIADRW